jgi:exopolysaccharide biosynthesis protein
VHPLRGQTTSGFVREHGLQVAINGSFFRPWHARGPFDYYPYVGDPVSVDGLAISNGRMYSPRKDRHDTLFVAKDGRVMIGGECANAMQAISGQEVFLRDGVYCLNPVLAASYTTAEPRTAVALSKDERTLYFFVVDGRQPNYSEGATMKEMAELIREHGGWTALHLDGGGSSTLVREGEHGRPIIVNSPIHGRHPPGRERPVANHLGVFAKKP